MFRECSELLLGRRFPLKLKLAVYRSYIRPAILYGSQARCLRDGSFMKYRDIHDESNVWSTAQR